jgi:hypothetical protein
VTQKNKEENEKKKERKARPVVQTYTPSYLGGRQSWFEATPGKVSEIPSQAMAGQSGMCLSSQLSLPDGKHKQEALGQAGPEIKQKPYLKNNQPPKGLIEWLKWYSTCLASMRS